MEKLKVLDLFSGIGGFSLGLERTGGFETVAFCEIDPFCRKVLKKHWPDVQILEDVKTNEFTKADVVTAGFPCQDASRANISGRAGTSGERTGLYREAVRAIRLVRPDYAVMENVAGLFDTGMGDVFGDLAFIGYDAEWDCLPTGVNFGHIRNRMFLVAHPVRERLQGRGDSGENRKNARSFFEGFRPPYFSPVDPSGYQWANKPVLGRGIHGIPHRPHRIKSLGNAVIPEIPEIIGKAILTSEGLI